MLLIERKSEKEITRILLKVLQKAYNLYKRKSIFFIIQVPNEYLKFFRVRRRSWNF